MSEIKSCHFIAVVPVYNHAATLPAVVAALRQKDLPCLLVDDGSEPFCAAVIDQLADKQNIFRLRLAHNQGKGAAVMAGLRHAQQLGYSHALQVDADGQHDLAAISYFIAAANAEPNVLICGHPIYDVSVPKLRLYARYLTHIWVWINTLSLSIPDSMCGFRVYPLSPSIHLINSVKMGKCMDFDTEFLVRMSWRNQAMRWLPIRVYYPEKGQSHFRPWRDNLLITWMHTRLFLGMLVRLPLLIWRKLLR